MSQRWSSDRWLMGDGVSRGKKFTTRVEEVVGLFFQPSCMASFLAHLISSFVNEIPSLFSHCNHKFYEKYRKNLLKFILFTEKKTCKHYMFITLSDWISHFYLNRKTNYRILLSFYIFDLFYYNLYMVSRAFCTRAHLTYEPGLTQVDE